MEWFRVIELMITSLTSIVIALVGAGFFRRMTDRKEKSKSKENLMAQIKKDEIIHLAIRDIRRRYNADRVYVWQFHNGGNYYTNAPMQKVSITYERCSEGLERKAEKNQNLLVSNFTSYIKDVMNLNMFFTDISNVPDIGLRAIMQSNGTKSHVAVPIYDTQKTLVGIFSVDWVFSKIPEDFLKQDGDFTQNFKLEVDSESDTLEKYLK